MTNHYSIKDLERISGIKAHTIRIWEKRYNIVVPERTESNIRYYSDTDLKRILNISVLISNGYKISRIAGLSDQQLCERIVELNNMHSPEHSGHIESLIVAMIELDEVKFEKVLNNSIIKIGFEETLFMVIYPLLSKIGTLWQTGSITPSQEHFLSNLVRQKLFTAIDGLPLEKRAGYKTFLLVLPQWELHDIGLLVYHYLIRKRGHKSIFLGQGVPLEDIASIKAHSQPEVIVTSFSASTEEEDIRAYLRELSEQFKDTPIYISGIQTEKISGRLPAGIQKFSSSIEFRDNVLNQYE
jgi:DNA-binding transcriptional MerR regulator/methylmalonyl-CoA mutase cobalamin-binding subunit